MKNTLTGLNNTKPNFPTRIIILFSLWISHTITSPPNAILYCNRYQTNLDAKKNRRCQDCTSDNYWESIPIPLALHFIQTTVTRRNILHCERPTFWMAKEPLSPDILFKMCNSFYHMVDKNFGLIGLQFSEESKCPIFRLRRINIFVAWKENEVLTLMSKRWKQKFPYNTTVKLIKPAVFTNQTWKIWLTNKS